MGIPRPHSSRDYGTLAIAPSTLGKRGPRTTRGMHRTQTRFKSQLAMIRLLRQRHRRMVIALGVTLPIVFSIGIAARKPVPSMASLPGELRTFSRESAATVWERSDLFAKAPIQARLLRESGKSGRFALELLGPRDFVKPDLIVYWVAGTSKTPDTLPNNALLLGSFSLSVFALPANMPGEDGSLVLYGLANNEIVAVSKPLRLANSNN